MRFFVNPATVRLFVKNFQFSLWDSNILSADKDCLIYFQFSLWDSDYICGFWKEHSCFQFSLWDSNLFITKLDIPAITFNSLYEILTEEEMIAKQTIDFQFSLWDSYSFFNSISSKYFAFFQFSLWDS